MVGWKPQRDLFNHDIIQTAIALESDKGITFLAFPRTRISTVETSSIGYSIGPLNRKHSLKSKRHDQSTAKLPSTLHQNKHSAANTASPLRDCTCPRMGSPLYLQRILLNVLPVRICDGGCLIHRVIQWFRENLTGCRPSMRTFTMTTALRPSICCLGCIFL